MGRRIHRWLACACVLVWISQASTGMALGLYRLSVDMCLVARSGAVPPILCEADQIGGHDPVGTTMEFVQHVHGSLASGAPGRTIIGLSGMFLLTQMMLGWRIAAASPSCAIRRKSHVRWGVRLLPVAAIFVAFGVMEAFVEPLSSWANTDWDRSEEATVTRTLTEGTARTLWAQVGTQTPEFGWLGARLHRESVYRFELHQPGILRGFPHRRNGELDTDRLIYSLTDPQAYVDPRARFFDRLEDVHSGAWLWPIGALLSLGVGLWLLLMISSASITLWQRYRRRTQKEPRA